MQKCKDIGVAAKHTLSRNVYKYTNLVLKVSCQSLQCMTFFGQRTRNEGRLLLYLQRWSWFPDWGRNAPQSVDQTKVDSIWETDLFSQFCIAATFQSCDIITLFSHENDHPGCEGDHIQTILTVFSSDVYWPTPGHKLFTTTTHCVRPLTRILKKAGSSLRLVGQIFINNLSQTVCLLSIIPKIHWNSTFLTPQNW